MKDSVNKLVGAKLIEAEAHISNQAAYYHRNKAILEVVAEALKKVNVTSAAVTTTCFDISIAGDKHTLEAVFAAFRKLGYEPTDRPDNEPKSTFSCYWDHPDFEARFWLYFSSTKCTRVKVGTEMKEVAIYETVCE